MHGQLMKRLTESCKRTGHATNDENDPHRRGRKGDRFAVDIVVQKDRPILRHEVWCGGQTIFFLTTRGQPVYPRTPTGFREHSPRPH